MTPKNRSSFMYVPKDKKEKMTLSSKHAYLGSMNGIQYNTQWGYENMKQIRFRCAN